MKSVYVLDIFGAVCVGNVVEVLQATYNVKCCENLNNTEYLKLVKFVSELPVDSFGLMVKALEGYEVKHE